MRHYLSQTGEGVSESDGKERKKGPTLTSRTAGRSDSREVKQRAAWGNSNFSYRRFAVGEYFLAQPSPT